MLIQRLAHMEAENNRLNDQVAQLSAEIRSSRGPSPQSINEKPSPTLAPILFKQEGEEPSLHQIPIPDSPVEVAQDMKASELGESSDLTQHPAAMLCDLQCQSEDSKSQQVSHPLSLTPDQMFNLTLQTMMQHLFLITTSTVYSMVILPLSQIFHSLKEGSPLMFSPEEIRRHLPLILWLISTPTLSTSRTSNRQSVFRIKLLNRLLACSPALARPLRDATSKALQQVASESFASGQLSLAGLGSESVQDWHLLLTTIWAIDRIERSKRLRKTTSSTSPLSTSSFSMSSGQRVSRTSSTRGKRSVLNRLRSSRSSTEY